MSSRLAVKVCSFVALKGLELHIQGIVLRTTARATNFTVILVGAGLSVVLAYALATELFAKNSPTVLYSDACDKIRASSAVRILVFMLTYKIKSYTRY